MRPFILAVLALTLTAVELPDPTKDLLRRRVQFCCKQPMDPGTVTLAQVDEASNVQVHLDLLPVLHALNTMASGDHVASQRELTAIASRAVAGSLSGSYAQGLLTWYANQTAASLAKLPHPTTLQLGASSSSAADF